MGLLKLVQMPVVTVEPETTVFEAVRIMDRENIGAVAVLDGNTIVGIFSERDVMLRVVLAKRDPEKTLIRTVMSQPVETIRRDRTVDEALKLMLEKHIRHLPVVTLEGTVAGMLSIRNLLHDKVEELTWELDSLEAYFTADGA